MSLRQRTISRRGGDQAPPPPPAGSVFNIIPVHDLLIDHPSLRYPEVRAAAAALRTVGDLPKPPFIPWSSHMDLLDLLGNFFGFQKDNVRNQREHLVLHLANFQMRLQPPPVIVDTLDPGVLRRFQRKLLHNYNAWCSYLGLKSNVLLSKRRDPTDLRRELLYVSLYLLIWGEAGNRRFTPECNSALLALSFCSPSRHSRHRHRGSQVIQVCHLQTPGASFPPFATSFFHWKCEI